jgi:hypothetical protein
MGANAAAQRAGFAPVAAQQKISLICISRRIH